MLAMMMVMGMSVTAFAEESQKTTITVNKLGEGTTLQILKVIEEDTTTETGWRFASDMAKKAYEDAFNSTKDQLIIGMLIKKQDVNAKVPTEVKSAATASQINDALNKLTFGEDDAFTNGTEVEAAGLYAIKATAKNYVYTIMTAYVGHDTYANGEPVSIDAKKTELNISKTNDTDKVVEIGSEVDYTISTNVPYINDAYTAVFKITDNITGASYVTSGGVISVDITLDGDPYTGIKTVNPKEENPNSFELDLSSIAADRNNANKKLVIKYKAKVTSTVVNNNVTAEFGEHSSTTATGSDAIYTGTLTLTKTGNNGALANAQFKLYKKVNNEKVYATVSGGALTGWTDYDSSNTFTTNEKGQITISGLDDSTVYYFKEIEAPEGYSVNEDDAISGNWTGEDNNRVGTASMTDTKLASLPETGGIGTTIFTIAGVILMIGAAAIYFARRRRA